MKLFSKLQLLLIVGTFFLLGSCNSRNFFIPDSEIPEMLIPPEYVKIDESGNEKIVIYPRERNRCHSIGLLKRDGSVRYYNYQCRYNRVLSVSEKIGSIFIIPESSKEFLGDDYGFFELIDGTKMMSRITRSNLEIPSETVLSIGDSFDKNSVWISTKDGAARFDPESRRSYNYYDWDSYDQMDSSQSEKLRRFRSTPRVIDAAESENFVWLIAEDRVFIKRVTNG